MAAKRLTPPASERAGTYEFNPEFQAHLLAVCLLTPDFVLRFGTALKPEYFGAVEHRDIASCLFAFVDKHKCLPHRDTFLEALRTARGSSSPALRAQIAKDLYGQDAGDGAAVAEVAVSFGRQRAVANAILAAAEKVQRNDMGDMLSGIQQAMMVGEDLTNLGIVYKDTERFEAYRRRLDPHDIIPTGIGHLDFALDGGLRRGELGVISAPPKRGKCLDEDSLVWTAERGYVPIKVLEGTPLTVVGVGPQLDGVRQSRPVGYVRDTVKPIYEITLRSGRVVRGFADTHPVLTMNGWIATADLRAGDCVLAPRVLPLSGHSSCAQERMAWLHGVMCGNGCIAETVRAPTLSMHVTDHDEVVDQVDRWFPALIRGEGNYRGNARTLRISSTYLRSCAEWGITRGKSRDKRIPHRVWSLGAKAIAAFVAGLFDTDGSAWIERGRPVVEWCTASHGLADDLLAALHVLGIYATVRHKAVTLGKKVFDAWLIAVKDGEGIQLLCSSCALYGAHKRKWDIARTAKAARGQFYHRVPPLVWEWAIESSQTEGKTLAGIYAAATDTKVRRKGSYHLRRAVSRGTRLQPEGVARLAVHLPQDTRIARHAAGAFAYDEVEAIRVVKHGPTVDIEVEDTHSFVAEGVITHNTSTLINLVFGAITHVQGYTVVHYSLEMDKHDVAARYDARLLGDKCILRYQDMDAYLVELEASLTQVVGNLRVQQYFTRAASIQTVRSHLSILAAQGFVPDLVVVDYADIMRPVRRLGEHRHEQAGIYEDLRQLAGEFNCGVWTASQTNRLSLDEETVGLVHTAESLEKVMIADLIISFCQTRDEAAHGLCRLFGAGCRRVDDGFTVECAINRKQCRITSTALLSAVNEEMPIPTSGKTHVARQAVRRIREAHAAGSVATGNKRPKEGEPPRRVRRLGVHA